MLSLREFIRANPSFSAMADAGNDSGITSALNAVDPTIVIQQESISPDYLRALSIAAFNGAVASGDAAKMSKWREAKTDAAGFTRDVQMSDPLLAMQLAAAISDGVLSQEFLNHYTTRLGSIAEREFGRFVTCEEVSAAMLFDRPDGKLAH